MSLAEYSESSRVGSGRRFSASALTGTEVGLAGCFGPDFSDPGPNRVVHAVFPNLNRTLHGGGRFRQLASLEPPTRRGRHLGAIRTSVATELSRHARPAH